MTTLNSSEGANSIVRENLTRLNRSPEPIQDGQPCEYLAPARRRGSYDHDIPNRRLNVIARELSERVKHHDKS